MLIVEDDAHIAHIAHIAGVSVLRTSLWSVALVTLLRLVAGLVTIRLATPPLRERRAGGGQRHRPGHSAGAAVVAGLNGPCSRQAANAAAASGLMIVRRILQLHGSEFRLVQHDGKGAVFAFGLA